MDGYDYSLNEIRGINGLDLETIYKYKKNYYLKYQNSERIKLECNNLIIDFSENTGDYVLSANKNWSIPFYDENENGFYDLEGRKYTVNKPFLIYNTFDKYYILYNQLSDCYYISTYNSNNSIKVNSIRECTENYVYVNSEDDRGYKLYLINNDKIEEVNKKIWFAINIGGKDFYSYDKNYGSVYDYYVNYYDAPYDSEKTYNTPLTPVD